MTVSDVFQEGAERLVRAPHDRRTEQD